MNTRMVNSRSKYHFHTFRAIGWEQDTDTDSSNKVESIRDARQPFLRKRRAQTMARHEGQFYNMDRTYRMFFRAAKGATKGSVDMFVGINVFRDSETESYLFAGLRRRIQQRQKRNYTIGQLRRAGYDVSDLRMVTRKKSLTSHMGKIVYDTFSEWMSSAMPMLQIASEQKSTLAMAERCRVFHRCFSLGLRKFMVQFSCGCCEDAAYFASVEDAERAFASSDQGNDLVDGMGTHFTDVDFFYGIREASEEKRGLGYLMDQITALSQGEDDE